MRQKIIHIIRFHPLTLFTDNRQEVEKIAHLFPLLSSRQLTNSCIELACLSHHRQGTIWCKIKNITVGLYTESFTRIWSLRSEGCLQILHCTICIGKEKYTCPLLDSDTRCHLSDSQRDRSGIFRMRSNGIANHLHFVISSQTALVITIAYNIDDNVIHSENRILIQQSLQRIGFLNSRQNPQSMPEIVAEFLRCERIIVLVIR